jgi:hypothetical protein
MRRLHLLLAALPLALAAGCGSPCEDLGDRICLCQPPGGLRDVCRNAVKDQIGKGNPKPTGTQQDFCEQTLRTCPNPSNDDRACDTQATSAGKIACGLAYPETAPAQ